MSQAEQNMGSYSITLLSYVNAYPFLYGLRQGEIIDHLSLSFSTPAQSAYKLQNNIVDIALLPIAVIPEIPKSKIITPYCIATDGAVKTVKLFSDCPLRQLERVYLDYQSRTSVQLIQVLFKYYWKKEVQFIKAEENYEYNIQGKTGGLVIGDRAFHWLNYFNHEYDLGEEWKNWTGLPFVFACWTTTQSLPSSFIDNFSNALSQGIKEFEKVEHSFREENPSSFSNINLVDYWSQSIAYHWNKDKENALYKFWEYTHQLSSSLSHNQ